MMEVLVTTGAISHAKLQSDCHRELTTIIVQLYVCVVPGPT